TGWSFATVRATGQGVREALQESEFLPANSAGNPSDQPPPLQGERVRFEIQGQRLEAYPLQTAPTPTALENIPARAGSWTRLALRGLFRSPAGSRRPMPTRPDCRQQRGSHQRRFATHLQPALFPQICFPSQSSAPKNVPTGVESPRVARTI